MEKEIIQIEINYSDVKTEESDNQVIFFRERFGYIRKYDKVVDLGREVVGCVETAAYHEFLKATRDRLKKNWEDVKLDV